MLPWPATDGKPKRASVNSFGYGGANAHAILEESQAHTRGQTHHVASIRSIDEVMSQLSPDDDDDIAVADSRIPRHYTLVLSANDAVSLKASIDALCNHLVNPRVQASLPDVAYTLSQRRSHLWHRAFVTASSSPGGLEIQSADFVAAKKAPHPPRVGLVFTGQGAQWPQMGRDLLRTFPATTRAVLDELDAALAGLKACAPPSWSLLEELTQPRAAEQLRQPEFSQPLVTALQICLLAVLEKWGVRPSSVVGHSSGEIAAAYAAGLLDRAAAIKAAFFRGRAVVVANQVLEEKIEPNLGMLAVGVDVETVTPLLEPYGGRASIACFNSPKSLTISGRKEDLEVLAGEIKAAGHFARLLQVDMAYHSQYMNLVGAEYESLMNSEGLQVLRPDGTSPRGVAMFSSVTTSKITEETPTDTSYWKSNLLSPVRFDGALQEMLSQPDHKSPDILVEVGPSGALAGPVSQILKSSAKFGDVSYCTAWSRGGDAIATLFDMAGRLFINGAGIDLGAVNQSDEGADQAEALPRCIIDLPSYRWNHSSKYWYESAASKDWRFRPFVTHDLIGSKILGTPWTSPSWHKRLALDDVPWLRDHKMGGDVLMPGAGFCAMSVEAMYQKHRALELNTSPEAKDTVVGVNDLAYGLRNVRFDRALVVQERQPVDVIIALTKLPRSSGDSGWHEFRISSSKDNVIVEHCTGLIRVRDAIEERLAEDDELRAPLRAPQPFSLWYKTQRDVGMDFGPAFQKIKFLEATSGERSCRATVDLTPPSSKWDPQSHYPLHPAVLDACLQSLMAPNAANERSLVKEIQIPGLANEAIINRMPRHGLRQGLVYAKSRYSGRGRLDQAKGIVGDVSLYDAETGVLLMHLKGLNYAKLDADLKPDPHVFDAVKWRPDITLLTRDQLETIQPSDDSQDGQKSRLDALIDLVAHKRPLLKVLEVNLDDDADSDIPSLWLGADEIAARQACAQYDFACTNAETLVAARKKHGSARQNVGFYLASREKQALGLDTAPSPVYDLVLVQCSQDIDSVGMETLCVNLEPLLSDGGHAVVVQLGKEAEVIPHSSGASSGSHAPSVDETNSEFGTGVGTPRTEVSQSEEGQIASSVSSLTSDGAEAAKTLMSLKHTRHLEAVLAVDDEPAKHYLFKMRNTQLGRIASHGGCEPAVNADRQLTVMIAHLSPRSSQDAPRSQLDQITKALEDALHSIGSPDSPTQTRWKVESSDMADGTVTIQPDKANDTIIVVPDELLASILAKPSPAQWTTLQALFATGCPLLWLTAGAASADPERAMAHGLLRVVRRELESQDEAARVVLDVDAEIALSQAPPTTLARAVAAVLELMREGRSRVEPEYLLRKDGVLEVPRLVPDVPVNEFRRFDRLSQGGAPAVAGLWETPGTVRLRGERVGALDLTWCECATEPLQEGYVEVEVEAVGVNFKVR